MRTAVAAAALLGILVASEAGAASPPSGSTAQRVVKYAPGLTVQSLANRPDSDFVEFPNGGRVSVADVRRLAALQQRMRSTAPGSRHSAALHAKPVATGTPLRNAGDLAAAVRRPETETVEFPSGLRATVAQVKLVQPLVERRLGRNLASLPQRPALTGPATQVSLQTPRAEWKRLMQGPPGTVLVTPSGKRITVGELTAAVTALFGPGSPGASHQAVKSTVPVAPGAATAPAAQAAPPAKTKKR